MKMTKSLYVIIIFIALIVFSGCSKKELNYTVSEVDGIKTYFNKNIPSDPNFKISPKELFTIDFSENNPDSSLRYINFGNLCADKEKNIYLVDYMKCKVTKVDSLGKFVTSFGKKGTGVKLVPGMVIALEPMLNAGTKNVTLDKDGYTFRTADGKPSAHFEHTILITNDGPEILTKI